VTAFIPRAMSSVNIGITALPTCLRLCVQSGNSSFFPSLRGVECHGFANFAATFRHGPHHHLENCRTSSLSVLAIKLLYPLGASAFLFLKVGWLLYRDSGHWGSSKYQLTHPLNSIQIEPSFASYPTLHIDPIRRITID